MVLEFNYSTTQELDVEMAPRRQRCVLIHPLYPLHRVRSKIRPRRRPHGRCPRESLSCEPVIQSRSEASLDGCSFCLLVISFFFELKTFIHGNNTELHEVSVTTRSGASFSITPFTLSGAFSRMTTHCR
jgi:hypothetical protein